MATDVSKMPELLAPAGGPDELAAALAAGADAVYFGLKKLNARTGAKNFPPEALQMSSWATARGSTSNCTATHKSTLSGTQQKSE